MAKERVTVTLPEEVLEDIDRRERNRSKFILTAVRHELQRRRREELRRSLRSPHPESLEVAELGIDEWANRLPKETGAELVEPSAGKKVRWTPEEGWVEEED
jgi:Arc/MetJ-type ribon-helix-helix transcriptional regulator